MSKIFWLVASMLVGIGLSAATAADFSGWQFTSGVGSRGTAFCGMMSILKNKNVGQNVIIKGSAKGLVVDLYKDKWVRPQGGSVRVAFDFVDNHPLVIAAYADAHILDAEIPTEDTSTFLLDLAGRPALQVILPDEESEPTWVIDGRGSKPVIEQMVSCMMKLVRKERP